MNLSTVRVSADLSDDTSNQVITKMTLPVTNYNSGSPEEAGLAESEKNKITSSSEIILA